MEQLDKIFFTAGDLVQVKHNLSNRPTMLVKGKETKTIRDLDTKTGDTFFKGIRCFWFTNDGYYMEEVFNTKDLEKV